jgi:hypothetical protein
MTAAKERPILFSAPMVRALLGSQKTQTRRVVKPYPKWVKKFPICNPTVMSEGHQVWWWNGEHDWVGVCQDCPYGTPGDRLWVRERWGINHYHYASPIPKVRPANLSDEHLVYYATEDDPEIVHEMPWRPSIHMPRWASRILLEIIDVRVERLNEISEADAKAEGAPSGWWDDEGRFYESTQGTHRAGFAGLWEHLNGPGSWDANPWVWVIEFKRVTGND